jgi:hypothetical protein
MLEWTRPSAAMNYETEARNQVARRARVRENKAVDLLALNLFLNLVLEMELT